METLNVILDIITSLGTIVATFSIVTAFILYRIQRKDDRLINTQQSLQILHNQAESIKLISDGELLAEMVNTVLYSNQMEHRLKNLYAITIQCKKKHTNHDESCKKFSAVLGVWIAPIQGPLCKRYDETLNAIRNNSLVFYPAYPGLYRFVRASARMLRNMLITYKEILLDEELISENIYSFFVEGSESLEDYESFCDTIQDFLYQLLDVQRKATNQKDLEELLALINIVYGCHSYLTKKEWNKLEKHNKKIKFRESDDIDTLVEEILEAEKGFEIIMSQQDKDLFMSLVSSIRTRNDTWNDRMLQKKFFATTEYSITDDEDNILHEI